MIIRIKKPVNLVSPVSILLCLAVACLLLPNEQYASPPAEELVEVKDPFALEVCVLVTVVIIGGVAVYKVRKYCKKYLGTNTNHVAQLERSTDLQHWQTVFSTNDPPGPFTFEWMDTAPMTNRAFYRASFP